LKLVFKRNKITSEDSLEIHPYSSKDEDSDESDIGNLSNGEESDDDSTDQTWCARKQDNSHKNGSGEKSPTKQTKKSPVPLLYLMFITLRKHEHRFVSIDQKKPETC